MAASTSSMLGERYPQAARVKLRARAAAIIHFCFMLVPPVFSFDLGYDTIDGVKSVSRPS